MLHVIVWRDCEIAETVSSTVLVDVISGACAVNVPGDLKAVNGKTCQQSFLVTSPEILESKSLTCVISKVYVNN